jgi:hypothetical protein
MYRQLFHTKPSIELTLSCIQILGYSDLNDHTIISRITMETSGAVPRFTNLLPRLLEIYIPCKFELFCRKSLDINACITITRQLLKTIGYDLVGKECVVNGVRMQKYELMTIHAKQTRKKAMEPEHRQQPIVLSFN